MTQSQKRIKIEIELCYWQTCDRMIKPRWEERSTVWTRLTEWIPFDESESQRISALLLPGAQSTLALPPCAAVTLAGSAGPSSRDLRGGRVYISSPLWVQWNSQGGGGGRCKRCSWPPSSPASTVSAFPQRHARHHQTWQILSGTM